MPSAGAGGAEAVTAGSAAREAAVASAVSADSSSAFIAFINVDGGIMFKVFVGRDETRTLRDDQLQRFHALAERIASARAA